MVGWKKRVCFRENHCNSRRIVSFAANFFFLLTILCYFQMAVRLEYLTPSENLGSLSVRPTIWLSSDAQKQVFLRFISSVSAGALASSHHIVYMSECVLLRVVTVPRDLTDLSVAYCRFCCPPRRPNFISKSLMARL